MLPFYPAKTPNHSPWKQAPIVPAHHGESLKFNTDEKIGAVFWDVKYSRLDSERLAVDLRVEHTKIVHKTKQRESGQLPR